MLAGLPPPDELPLDEEPPPFKNSFSLSKIEPLPPIKFPKTPPVPRLKRCLNILPNNPLSLQKRLEEIDIFLSHYIFLQIMIYRQKSI